MNYTEQNIENIVDFWLHKIGEVEGFYEEDKNFLPIALKTYTYILLDLKNNALFGMTYNTFSLLANYAFIKGLAEPQFSKSERLYQAQQALSQPSHKMVVDYLQGLTQVSKALKNRVMVEVYPGAIHSVCVQNAFEFINVVYDYMKVLENKNSLEHTIEPVNSSLVVKSTSHKI